MNSVLIAVIAAVLLVVLILVLKKITTKKVPPTEIQDVDTTVLLTEEAAEEKENIADAVQEVSEETVEPLVEEELTLKSDIVDEPELIVETEVKAKTEDEPEEPSIEVEQPLVELEEVEAGEEKEDIADATKEDVGEQEELLAKDENVLTLEPEAVVEGEVIEPESAGQSDVVDEPERIAEAEVEAEEETVPEELSFDIEQPVAEDEAVDVVEVQETEAVVALSIESYEQRLLALRDKQQAALNTAMENNEEKRREQLQSEFVAITEAMDFLDQSYEQEVSCRNDALIALKQVQAELDAEEYDRVRESIRSGDIHDAEEVFDAFVEGEIASSALAAYHSGCLAECRLDLSGAMERFEKAVSLDGENPDYLRSAALLARRLYRHKQALSWFAALEKVLEARDEESVELALARRELAYSAALVGRHKQAGGLYKKAMVSLSNLLGKQDPELGICWYQIGKLQEALGKYDMAEEPYKKALALLDTKGRNVILIDILGKLAG